MTGKGPGSLQPFTNTPSPLTPPSTRRFGSPALPPPAIYLHRKVKHIRFTLVFPNCLLPGASDSYSRRKRLLLFLFCFFPGRPVLPILHHGYLDPELNAAGSHVMTQERSINRFNATSFKSKLIFDFKIYMEM